MIAMPYVGLRPFECDEYEIFFGREKCIDELLDLLPQRTFFAVVGEAYCGKTSLIRCGLEARLLQNNKNDSIIQWHIANFRPDSLPFFQISDSLLKTEGLGCLLQDDFESQSEARQFLRQNLSQGSLSLHNLLDRKPLPKGHKLLLVCDQFEDVFHLWEKDSQKAQDFVDFLIGSSKPHPLRTTTSHDVHVIITMRSAYLDKVPLFPELEEVIRNNIYLTPRLNKEQLRAAIRKPPQVFDKLQSSKPETSTTPAQKKPPSDEEQKPANANEEIDKLYENMVAESSTAETQSNILDNMLADMQRHNNEPVNENKNTVSSKLTDHLLEIVDASGDQLPRLQHLLMRMWELCPETQEHYLMLELLKKPRINSFDEALTSHLDETLTALKEPLSQKIVEILFRKLMAVKGSSRPRLLHQPVKLKTIAHLADTSIEEVIKVIDVFRTPDRAFLNPPRPERLKADTLIELSHESIVRHWSKIQDWKKKEMEAEQKYLKLDKLARKHQEEEGELLQGQLLDELWQWYQQNEFNTIWAHHYGCNFKRSKHFLITSKSHDTLLRYIKRLLAACVVFMGIYFVYDYKQQQSHKEDLVKVLFDMKEDLITEKSSPKLEKQFHDFTVTTPSNVDGWLYYGSILAHQKKWNQAGEAFRKAYEIDNGNIEILLHLIEALTKEKKFAEAIGLLNQALEDSPDNPQLLHHLADVLSHQDKLKDAKKEQLQTAIDKYQQSLNIDPDNSETLSKLGRALGLQGQHEAALEKLEKAVKLNKDSVINWKNLGLEHLANGKKQEAIKALTTALGLEPNDDENWRNLGLALLENNDLDEATEAFEKAIHLNKESDENHRNLGNVLMERGKLDEALKAYNTAQDIKMSKATLIQKAKLLAKQNKFDEASSLYQKALSFTDSEVE